jgi:hypothetical protein
MSLSMVFALSITAWHSAFKVAVGALQNEGQKAIFAGRLLFFSRNAYQLYTLSTLTFSAAFSVFGYIKNRGTVGVAEPADAFYVFAPLMVAAGSLSILGQYHAQRLGISVRLYSAATPGNNSGGDDDDVVEMTRLSSAQQSDVKPGRPKCVPGRAAACMISLVNSVADQTTFVGMYHCKALTHCDSV